MQTFHGTVVDKAGRGIFLRGPSGVGKSDLALRLMDRGASLVADDQVVLEARASGLKASAPETLFGLIEMRGVGIVSVPAIRQTRIKLIVDLVDAEEVERLPYQQSETIKGLVLPILRLNAFEHSSVLKIEHCIANLSCVDAGDMKGA